MAEVIPSSVSQVDPRAAMIYPLVKVTLAELFAFTRVYAQCAGVHGHTHLSNLSTFLAALLCKLIYTDNRIFATPNSSTHVTL